MNAPQPSQDTQRAVEWLDRCLARMRRGLPLERAGSDAPEQAQELAPLLALAQSLTRWGAQPIPAPPADLLPGRVRFLEAAACQAAMSGSAAGEINPDRLDAAVAQLAAGRSPEEALAHLNGDRIALRPLVQLVDQLRSSILMPPPAPHGLRPGRALLLAAAAQLRMAAAAEAAPPSTVWIALDDALERQSHGLQPATGLDPNLASQVMPLAALAAALQTESLTVPPPPGGLTAGRHRFLAQAERLRLAEQRLPATARPAPKRSAGSWWTGVFGGSLRLAASAAAALALFFGGTRALETSASQSLPGDLLYPVKRANEGLDRMLVAFDKQELHRLRVEQAGRRAQEISQLAVVGRDSERWLDGAFLGLETTATGGDTPQGILRLRVPAQGDPATVLEVVWNGRSRFVIGDPSIPGAAADDPGDLTIGQALRLRLLTGPNNDLPLLLILRTTGSPPVPTPALLPATAIPAASATPPGQTVTPVRPLSSRTPLATVRPPASETPAATATLASAPVNTGEVPAAAATADRGLSRVEGMVVAKPDPATLWTLREFNGASTVDVDVSDIDPALRDSISVGDAVRISYRRGSAPRRAVRILVLQSQACPLQSAVGTLRSFDGDLLVLDDGRSFRVGRSARVVGDLQPGAELSLSFRDCGSGLQVESVEASARSAFVGTGLVGGLVAMDGGIRFDLLMDDGTRQVRADGQTLVGGRGLDGVASLIPGLLVRVIGQEDKNGMVLAVRIEILALVQTPAASATAEPSPSMTPVPPTQQPTAAVETFPLPIDPARAIWRGDAPSR